MRRFSSFIRPSSNGEGRVVFGATHINQRLNDVHVGSTEALPPYSAGQQPFNKQGAEFRPNQTDDVGELKR